MNMSHRQTKYFLGRFLLFWNRNEIARRLSTSRLTVDRWCTGETQPRLSMLPIFQETLIGLIDHLDDHQRKWGFGRLVADLLEEGEFPKHEPPIRFVKNEASMVRAWLRRQLERPRKSHELLAAMADAGFTRSQMVHASNKLGVIKTQKGAGRGSYSIWRLPE